MAVMTSRERILRAINRQPVDRVPIDLGGTRQTGIAAFAYAKLRTHLGVGGGEPFRVFDVYQMLAEIEDDVANRFGSDCVALNRPAVAFGIENADWKPKPTSTSSARWRAGMSSLRSTTSRPTCRPRTSSPTSTPP